MFKSSSRAVPISRARSRPRTASIRARTDCLRLAVQPDGKILVGGDFTTLGGGGSGRSCATASAGSTPTARSTPASIRARTATSTFWRCSRTARSWSAARFTTLGGGRHDAQPASAGSTPTARSTPASIRARTASSTPWPCSRTGRSWSAASSRRWAAAGPDDDAQHRPAQRRRLARHRLQSGRERTVVYALGGAAGREDPGRRRLHDAGRRRTGTTPRNRIGRLNADGSLDASFNPGANGAVFAMAVQPDGKILVGGVFTTLGGGGTGTTTRNRIGRLNADGSLDTGFNPGANGTVCALAVQPDGKILVGGGFTTLRRRDRHDDAQHIGRLNADGSLDTSFNPGANDDVYAVAVQPDGKILVGGDFTTLGGGGRHDDAQPHRAAQRRRLARHHLQSGRERRHVSPWRCSRMGRSWSAASSRCSAADGTRTRASAGSTPTARSTPASIRARTAVRLRAGGAAGWEDPGRRQLHDARRRRTGTTPRTASAGSTPTARSTPTSIRARTATSSPLAVQPDGKILVGGAFTTLGGGGTGTTARNRIGRLNADGSLDTSFDPGANGDVVHAWRCSRMGRSWSAATSRARRRRDRHDAAQPHRPAQRRRLARHRASIPARTAPSTPWRCSRTGRSWSAALHDAGRRRHRHDDAQPHRPAQRRRLARRQLQSGRERDAVYRPWRVQADGKILVGGNFTGLARGDRRDSAQPDRPAHRRRLARRHLRSGREQRGQRPGAAAGREDPGRRRVHDAGRRRDRHDAARNIGRLTNTGAALQSLSVTVAAASSPGRAAAPGRRSRA